MRSYLKLIGILLLPLVFVTYYAYSPVQIPPPGWKLGKMHTPFPRFSKAQSDSTSKDSTKVAWLEGKSSSKPEPSVQKSLPLPIEEQADSMSPDTSLHRILFFGDSMVEGLLRRMNCYAYTNGHDVTNVVWYSSTTELWAQTDTLRHFIDKVQPTFAMISIGANEQFIKNAAGREASIRQIMRLLGDTPFVWIGVPAWREDTGINELTKQIVGEKRYFDSRNLTLQRGRDRMHPTFNAASRWMDRVAEWMASPATAHPIRMDKPSDNRKHTYRTYALQPMK